MSPLSSVSNNSTLVPYSSQSSPDLGGMIINIVFGVCACVIGAVTIWQGYKAWMVWRAHGAAAGFPSEDMPPALDSDDAFPLSHTVASTPHVIDGDRLAAGGDEQLPSQNTGEGQYAAVAGEGSPLPSVPSHAVLVAEGFARDERESSQVAATGEV